MSRKLLGLLAAGVFAAACTDAPSLPIDPMPATPAGAALLECRVEVAPGTMRCGPATPAQNGASMDLILGGQGTYVQLANSGNAVAEDTFSTLVTVQNLTVQALGTPDGTTVSPRGVRVFFFSGPTNGVEVGNEDGAEMYLEAVQPFFQYDGILQPQATSGGKTWKFALNGAAAFSFKVYVVAEVPSETGLLLLQPADAGTTGALRDVWGNGSSVVAVGSGGTIRASSDGGATWSTVDSGVTSNLLDVWGDGSTLWAVGSGGVILRSLDAGATWQPMASNSTCTLQGVWSRGLTVVAAGFGCILRSADGGTTWSSVRSSSESLTRVWGNDSAMLVIGTDFTNSTILRSTDGGVTWTPISAGGSESFLQAVWSAGSTFVVAGSGGTILRSTDNGQSWAPVASPTTNGLFDGWGVGSTLIGVGSLGTVIRSTDLGLTWHTLRSGVPQSFFGVWMRNEARAVLVGDAGVVLRGTR
jgi:photosystem II stability/assembly factor-like uncharacterized protein